MRNDTAAGDVLTPRVLREYALVADGERGAAGFGRRGVGEVDRALELQEGVAIVGQHCPARRECDRQIVDGEHALRRQGFDKRAGSVR